MFASPFAVVYIVLWGLRTLIPGAHLLVFEWTFLGVLFRIWFLFFVLGISIEGLTYAGWLLLKVLRKREDGGDQKYRIMAVSVWRAAETALLCTLDKYLGVLRLLNGESCEMKNTHELIRSARHPP